MSLTVLLAVAFVGAALYYVCPLRLRWVLLLLLSYGFYLTCGLSALPFIALTTLTTWAGALVIARVGESGKAYLRAHKAELTAEAKKAQKARTRSRQRVWFFAVLLLNFGVLAVLKYLNPVMAWGASLLGGSAPSLGLGLPLGISFYTFQSMGYLIDVYNGKYAPEKNPAKFALFVSFFPQLIQGPIARFDQLESQLVTPHRFDLDGIERGLLLMLWGWFKKKVIADRALSLVEAVFGNQSAYGGAVIVVGVLFYSLQQYADFSGGIDLVAGVTTFNEVYTVSKAMCNAAREVILMADSSKFGRKSPNIVCGLERVDKLITDADIDPEFQRALEAKGIEVIITGEHHE